MMRKAIYSAVFLSAFAAYFLTSVNLGTLNAPPELGDGQDYDAIAFNIAHHRGFGFDWDDPEWRQPYLQFPIYQGVLDRHSNYYPTTYRPPAMPYLLAFVYGVAGRNFAAWRVLSCAIMAGTATVAAAIAAEFAGAFAAIVTAILILQSPQLATYAHTFLTEGLATFLLALLAWIWIKNSRTGWTSGGAAGFGIVLGLLVAARHVFILWIPIALLVPAVPTVARTKDVWQNKVICLLAALLIIGPWWIRNIIVTRAFMPFGTEGGINLPAGFSPMAIQLRGIWAPTHSNSEQEIAASNLDPVTSEVRLAKIRSSFTLHWMTQHPLEVMHLMLLHVWQEVRSHGEAFSDWLLFIGALGVCVFRKSRGVWIIALFVALNLLGIALTWSVEGRFMVPLHPLLVAMAGAMTANFARQLLASLHLH